MNADVGSDDELLACEPDARDRQELILKSNIRRRDVHHDFRLRLRQCAEIMFARCDFRFTSGNDADTAGRIHGD